MNEVFQTSGRPNVLYKYRTDNAYSEQLISAQQVFLATPEQLNDPFECTLQDISHEWMANKVVEAMQAALAGFVMSVRGNNGPKQRFFGLRPAQAERALTQIMSSGRIPESYEAMRAFIRQRTGRPPTDCRTMFARMDDQIIRTGIFSMSAISDQPLMWAHYAGDHSGICLGFEAVKGSKLANSVHCLPVIYSDELPTMDKKGLKVELVMRKGAGRLSSEQAVAFDDVTFQRVVTTKLTDWKYEQEYRYIERTGGLQPWPGRLAECTFGLRCNDDRRRRYIELIEEHAPNDVLLFEMRKVRGTNRLERVALVHHTAEGRGERHPVDVGSCATGSSETLDREAFAARMQERLLAGDYDEIILQTGDNLKRNPTDPMLHALKAQAHGFAREDEKAYRHFARLSELLPDAADGWFGIGVALTQLGRFTEAIAPLRRAYQIDPNDKSHALNLGVLLIGHEDSVAEGLACLRQADRLGHRRAGRIIREVEDGERPPAASVGG